MHANIQNKNWYLKKLQEQNLKQIINLQKQNKILKKKLEDGEF